MEPASDPQQMIVHVKAPKKVEETEELGEAGEAEAPAEAEEKPSSEE